MNLLNSKYTLLSALILFLLALTSPMQAQESPHERKVERYRSFWDKLIPRYAKMQFAGGMGVLSFGTGWDYGKNKQWETDVLFGFVPKFKSDKTKFTMTLKQNFIPWKIQLNDNFYLCPLTTGLYINTVLDDDYWAKQPDYYASKYYQFSTRFRMNVFAGQVVDCHFKKRDRLSRYMSFYYEFSTNELLLIDRIRNKSMGIWDYMSLSFGLKFQFL